ncbi:MAG: CarD family transcriptional regulator [Lactobacillales bacterium]|jgi:CarD family transcriptional regulator|nr:CarD family transcriptional regulator [Lactobacillales bacterium]
MPEIRFNPGDFVVYPAHGVGQITDIQVTAIAGQNLELIAINFNKDKLTLRIPLSNARKTGLRRVVSPETMDSAIKVLKEKSKTKRVQWSKRSQEYTLKINSGDPIAVAEVLRDLFKDPSKKEQTYSERQIFEQAMARLAAEYAVVNKVKEEVANVRLSDILYGKLIAA